MSMCSLADRFQIVQTATAQSAQHAQWMEVSFEDIGNLTIRFGDSKLGQKYSEVVRNDQKYCLWFIRKYSESSKPEHKEFLHYLDLYTERQELELKIPDASTMLVNIWVIKASRSALVEVEEVIVEAFARGLAFVLGAWRWQW